MPFQHPNFNTYPFEKTDDTLLLALGWLETLGIRIHATRFQTYIRVISRAPEVLDTDYQRRLYNAIIETEELRRIFLTLREAPNAMFIERLEKYVAGPEFYTSEQSQSSSNAARNYGFELALAARAWTNGHRPLERRDADIAWVIDGHTVVAQCKRPLRNPSFRRRISEAASQLQANYSVSNGPRVRGVVAIDMTRLVNPAQGMPSFQSKQELHEKMTQSHERLLTKFDKFLPLINFPSQTIGVIVLVRSVALLPPFERPEPCVCEQISAKPLPQTTHRGEVLLQSLLAALTVRGAA